MTRTARIALAFHVCAFGLALSGYCRAGERALCTTLSTHSSIIENNIGHRLRITVQNPTQQIVETEEFYFWSNGVRFRAIAKTDGHQLRTIIPFIDPGMNPLLIKPDEVVVRELPLEDVFPDLQTVLRSSDIDVSWTVKLKPNKGCFSEEATTTVTLDRVR